MEISPATSAAPIASVQVLEPDATVPAQIVDASTAELPGEKWEADMLSDPPCENMSEGNLPSYQDPHGPKRKFSYDGYVHRSLEVLRMIGASERRHCVEVYWPSGPKSQAGRPVRVASRIDAAWFRLLERSLVRLPWRHLSQVARFVIDNRPILHGIAPFDRGKPAEDARDGHSIWLNEELFVHPNHWATGNYGQYWAYHTQEDRIVVDGQTRDHQFFSPVLLHEIGHIVNYNLVNGAANDPNCPPCARMCGDFGTCKSLSGKQQEELCVTAYCTSFEHSSGTENWAEMYRWFNQGQETRDLLKARYPECFGVLDAIDHGRGAPWDEGMGQVFRYRRTLWDSCAGKACLDR